MNKNTKQIIGGLLFAATFTTSIYLLNDKGRPFKILEPGQPSSGWTARCYLQHEGDSPLSKNHVESPQFEMECWFDDGYHVRPNCEFPNASEIGDTENPMFPSSVYAIYRGENALKKAKRDFSSCSKLESIVFNGSRKDFEVAISPWTNQPITLSERQELYDFFSSPKYSKPEDKDINFLPVYLAVIATD